MTASPEITVVIPTHNRAPKLVDTLDHLDGQTVDAGWEVIVVANNCEDDTVLTVRDRTERFPVPLTVLEEPKPGAAAARNAGARRAAGRDLLFLDDDILVEPDCIDRLLRDRHEHPGAWIVGQVFPLPEHRATPFGAFRAASLAAVGTDGPPEEVEWFASGIALVPKAALLDVGGYDETFTTAALEDADLAIRAVRAGVRVVFDPGLTSRHNDSAGTAIRDYCRRARIHCATAPQLERRFGTDGHPWSSLILGNRPPSWPRDGPRAIAKKLLKRAGGTAFSLSILFALADRLERRDAPSGLLWTVYRAAIAGSMYAGFQEGLQRGVGSAEPAVPSP